MLAWAIVEENAERGVQGFAESYMLGEVTCSDLVAFFQVRSPIKSCYIADRILLITFADFHPQSHTALQCHDSDLILGYSPDRSSAKYEHSSQLPVKCVCPL